MRSIRDSLASIVGDPSYIEVMSQDKVVSPSDGICKLEAQLNKYDFGGINCGSSQLRDWIQCVKTDPFFFALALPMPFVTETNDK